MKPMIPRLAGIRSFLTGLVFLCALGSVQIAKSAAISEKRIEDLFRATHAESIALSPDGRHLAYTQHGKDALNLIILDVDKSVKVTSFALDGGRALPFSDEKEPTRLRFLKWANAKRIVFAPTSYTVPAAPYPDYRNGGTMPNPGGPIIVAPIFAADFDGKNAEQLVDSRSFEVMDDPGFLRETNSEEPPPPPIIRSRATNIIGFADRSPDKLIIEVRGFRVGSVVTPTEAFLIDVYTGKSSLVSSQSPFGSYSYDRQGQARLFFPRTSTNAKHDISYHGPNRKGSWTPLENNLPGWESGSFETSTTSLYGERTVPIGFGYQPELLYIATNKGRDTFAVFASQMHEEALPRVAVEHARADFGNMDVNGPTSLLFDDHQRRFVGARSMSGLKNTIWVDEELAAFQRAAESSFPNSKVELLEWSLDRMRFLIRVSSGTDPGRCYVYQRSEKRMREVTRSAPWLDAAEMHDTRFFTLVQSEGNHITGYITIPKHPKVSAAPVIVAFAPGFPARAHPVYDPQAHVLADMGFVVIRINQRGTEGFGRRFRDSLDGGIAKCAAEDALAAVNWAKSQTTLDTTRVALLGEDFAGFLALKALQLNPSAFRCAITFNAPIVPDSWLPDISDRNIGRQARRALLERSDPSIEELSLLKRNNPLLRPAFMVVHSVNNGAIAADSATLKSRLSKEGVPSTYREVHDDFALKLPLARARVYRELEEFLNLHLYDFNVKVGESKEVK